MPVPQEINVFVGLISATGKMPVPQEINVFVGWASCPPRSPLLKILSVTSHARLTLVLNRSGHFVSQKIIGHFRIRKNSLRFLEQIIQDDRIPRSVTRAKMRHN